MVKELIKEILYVRNLKKQFKSDKTAWFELADYYKNKKQYKRALRYLTAGRKMRDHRAFFMLASLARNKIINYNHNKLFELGLYYKNRQVPKVNDDNQ